MLLESNQVQELEMVDLIQGPPVGWEIWDREEALECEEWTLTMREGSL